MTAAIPSLSASSGTLDTCRNSPSRSRSTTSTTSNGTSATPSATHAAHAPTPATTTNSSETSSDSSGKHRSATTPAQAGGSRTSPTGSAASERSTGSDANQETHAQAEHHAPPSSSSNHWETLSPRALETLRTIALPISFGHSYADIAATLHVSTKTVRRRLAELRNELTATLTPDSR